MFSRSGEGGEDEMVHFVPGRFLRFLRGRREKKAADSNLSVRGRGTDSWALSLAE
jgi:hypothetical protein